MSGADRIAGRGGAGLAAAALLSAAIPHLASAQHFSSARGVSLGAYTGVSADLGALDWNPAGLAAIRDWEFSASNFLQLRGSDRSASLHHGALGKRFLPGHAAAVRYSPGIRLEFAVPSTFTVEDSGSTISTKFDKEISYAEQFAIGYAVDAGRRVSIGFSAHFLEERVADTDYSIDTNNVITGSPVVYTANGWTVDWGVVWRPAEDVRIGAAAKNLFRITESTLPTGTGAPPLEPAKTVRAGASYEGFRNLLLAAEAGTDRRLRAGVEWAAAGAIDIGAGAHVDARGRIRTEAFGAGVTAGIGNVTASAAVLLFTDQTDRSGSAGLSRFSGSEIESIEFSPFTGNRASFSISVDLGRTRDPIARIEYVEMLSDIHPASSQVYAFRPVGRARVRNVADTPIEATVSFRIDRFMDAETESRPQTILPGETAEIPFFAVLNSAVGAVRTLTVGEGEVSVSAVRREGAEDSYPTRVLVRGKNEWNGDVTLLKYFLTPGDPAILSLTRAILAQSASASAADGGDARLADFRRARALFDALAGRLNYVNDPRGSQDHVQYPAETVDLGGGDCDDLTVLLCSMLSSVGIRTAFVDVVPPQAPDSAHIFLMFDTGVRAEDAALLSGNPKRVVIRRRAGGAATAWVPLETTLTRRGFDAAWEDAANQYYRSVEIGMGIAHGWVRVVDHDPEF